MGTQVGYWTIVSRSLHGTRACGCNRVLSILAYFICGRSRSHLTPRSRSCSHLTYPYFLRSLIWSCLHFAHLYYLFAAVFMTVHPQDIWSIPNHLQERLCYLPCNAHYCSFQTKSFFCPLWMSNYCFATFVFFQCSHQSSIRGCGDRSSPIANPLGVHLARFWIYWWSLVEKFGTAWRWGLISW